MRAVRLLWPVFGVLIASNALAPSSVAQSPTAPSPTKQRGGDWFLSALQSIASEGGLNNADERLRKAERAERIEQRQWEEAVGASTATPGKPSAHAAKAARAAAKSDESSAVGGNDSSTKPKKIVGASPGNPTGKRVHRKTPVDGDPIGPTIIVRPY